MTTQSDFFSPDSSNADTSSSVSESNAATQPDPAIQSETSAHASQQEPEHDTRDAVLDDSPYAVGGMDSPFLGLRSFTYANRSRYAGHNEALANALDVLTRPGEQLVFLLVTGASGSGKSSFIQAGLLPALEKQYEKQHVTTRSAVFRPSYKPFDSLFNALLQLGIPASMLNQDVVSANPSKLNLFLSHTTMPNQVNILVIDQFDELFTLAEAEQREALFSFFDTLSAFNELRTHIIAPVRSDYLPYLFERKALFEATRHAIDLRALSVEELKEAIQRPVQQIYPQSGKHFEPQLLHQLAQDASQDASALPLLQAMLHTLWWRGNLTFNAYTSLDMAIDQYAEDILTYADYAGARNIERPSSECQAIMGIFLDLVDTSSDDGTHKDKRLRLPAAYLYHSAPSYERDLSEQNSEVSTSNSPKTNAEQGGIERSRLIEELCHAHLLRKSVDVRGSESVEMIEIVHEALVTHWGRLQRAIQERHAALPHHIQGEQMSRERLMAVYTPERSQRTKMEEMRSQTESHRNQEGPAGKESQKTLQGILNKRKKRRQTLRRMALLFAVTLILALGIGGYWRFSRGSFSWQNLVAFNQQSAELGTLPASGETVPAQDQGNTSVSNELATVEAQQQTTMQTAVAAQQTSQALQQSSQQREQRLKAQELTLEAKAKLGEDPQLGLLLALEAAKTDQGAEVERVLRQAVQVSYIRLNLRGHRDVVWSAAYSPNGQYIVTASDDQTARLWNAITGEELQVLRGHEAGIWSAAFSPDGQRIVTASEDQTARVWDTTSGEQALVLTEPDGRINNAVFSPDGKHILTTSDGENTRIWDASTGEEVQVLRGGGGARHAVYSPDGERIATANYDQRVRVWNAETGGLFFSLYGHEDIVWSVAFSPDSERLITTSADKTVRIWNAKTGAQLHTFEQIDARDAVFSPDGTRIVTAGWDNTARIWNAETGEEQLVLRGHTAVINSVAFKPDGQHMVTASADHKVRIWDTGYGAELFALTAHEAGVTRAVFDNESNRIATASADGKTHIWDATTGTQLMQLGEHTAAVQAVTFSPDGQHIATVSADKTARIWNAANGLEQHLLNQHEDIVWSVAFSPDGQRMVTASQDRTARVWRVENGQQLVVLRGHEGGVHSATFHPDGDRIATASGDGTIRVWAVETGKELQVLRGHEGGVNSVRYNLEGTRIVSSGADQTVHVWEAETGDILLVLRGHEASVHYATFSPDGTRILTASSDSTARLWDAASGELLVTLEGHRGRVNSAMFSPDGQYIVTASQDQTARLYYATFEGILSQAKRAVTRNLTDEERTIYLEE